MDARAAGGSVDLTGPWLFHLGDDPGWAAPGLDDSRWMRVASDVSLRKYGITDPKTCWYRIHVRVRPDARNVALWLDVMATNVAVYANGQWIGQNGSVNPGAAILFGTIPTIRIPDRVVAASDGDLVLAIHIYQGPMAKLGPGMFAEGTHVWLTTPADARVVSRDQFLSNHGADLAVAGLETTVGFCGVFLFLAMRSRREYLALAIWMLARAANGFQDVWMRIHRDTPLSPAYWLYILLAALTAVASIEFVRLITGTRRTRSLLGLEVVVVAVMVTVPLALAGKLPLGFSIVAFFVPLIVADVLLPILLLRSALKKNLDALLMLVPFVLWALLDFYQVVALFDVMLLHKRVPATPEIHFYSYAIPLQTIFDVLGLLALLLIVLTRTTRLARERASLAAEVEAAEQVQALLLARASQPTPGYAVETVYRPMGEVGGDFFLVSPDARDGSLLVTVGDVSGKGMGAAMRVSLILGVLSREDARQPASVLADLNEALLAQGQMGFTTACCVRLERDGRFSFSNAGHLNPYVNGEELESPGMLPLGLSRAPEFEEMHGVLRPGDRMILLSDGVPEARAGKGELLGFDRVVTMVRMTAEEIAEAAQEFGQTDDITVLSLALA
jgi:hypothetical protein